MITLTVASLHIHPIKSLGGFATDTAHLTDRGFAHDRRWMLVDADDRFITQREVPAMACLHCAPHGDGFRVIDLRDGNALDLPWTINDGEEQRATVWDDAVSVLCAPATCSAWFRARLGVACHLVHMPDSSQRDVDARYTTGITSLSDAFPYLLVSQASLDDLNMRMLDPLPMDRFRPNIVIAGGAAFQEDLWRDVLIGGVRFTIVKPCGRCVITTTDQRTGARGKEPLSTLATYRKRAGSADAMKVDFGMHAVAQASGTVRVGDHVRPVATDRTIPFNA